jgi:undecaprenyl-diphosphatase
MLILIAVGTSTLVTAIKLLIGRARPDITDLLTIAPGYAFPSGHSAQAAATYATLAYLLSARLRRWRPQVAVWTVAALIVVLVGFSRLYLGAHWLTDVLGGYALGAAWTALVITTTVTIRHAQATAPPATPPQPTAPPARQPPLRHNGEEPPAQTPRSD